MREHISASILRSAALCAFLCAGIASTGFAQTAPKIEWQRCLGGSEPECSSPGTAAIGNTDDGGLIVVLSTNSNDGDISGTHGVGNPYADDIWLAKLDASGLTQWSRCYGGSSIEHTTDVLQTSDHGFVITATAKSNDGDVSGNHGDFDAWVLKVDSTGAIQWQKCYGGTAYDGAGPILQTADGGYLIVAQTASKDSDVTGFRGGSDTWVLKLSDSGSIRWAKCYGAHGIESSRSVAQASDGGYVLAGWTTSSEEGFPHHGSSYNTDAYIIKITADGDLVWQKSLGGSNDDYALSIVRTEDDGYLFVGSTRSNDGDVSGLNGVIDAWVVKLDTLGNITWQKCFGGSAPDEAWSILKEVSGDYVVCGSTRSNDGDLAWRHSTQTDSSDVWVFSVTASGKMLWQESLGGSRNEQGFSIIQRPDHGFAFIATTESDNGDVSGYHGRGDVWLAKLAPLPALVDGTSTHSDLTYPFPNPSSLELYQELSDTQPVEKVQFFNSIGVQCYPEYRIQLSTLSIGVRLLPSGVYFCRITYANSKGGYTSVLNKFVVSR